MKCTGVTGIRLESFKDINVGESSEPLDPSSPSMEPYPNIWREKHTYKGSERVVEKDTMTKIVVRVNY